MSKAKRNESLVKISKIDNSGNDAVCCEVEIEGSKFFMGIVDAVDRWVVELDPIKGKPLKNPGVNFYPISNMRELVAADNWVTKVSFPGGADLNKWGRKELSSFALAIFYHTNKVGA